MAHLDREPFFTLKKTYKDSADTTFEIHRFEKQDRTKRIKTTVTKEMGHDGIDFTLEKTVTKFKEVQNEHMWRDDVKWTNFRRCPVGPRKVTWDNLVAQDYPGKNNCTTAEFNNALDKWRVRILITVIIHSI